MGVLGPANYGLPGFGTQKPLYLLLARWTLRGVVLWRVVGFVVQIPPLTLLKQETSTAEVEKLQEPLTCKMWRSTKLVGLA